MTIETDIQTALLTHLTTPALSGAPPIAYPLVPYSPVPGTAYLHAHPILRAVPLHPFVAHDSDTIHQGIFQVDAVVPDNQGEAPGLQLAGLVVARFAVGTNLAAGAYRLKILRPPAVAGVVLDKPWARYPVSVRYWLCEG